MFKTIFDVAKPYLMKLGKEVGPIIAKEAFKLAKGKYDEKKGRKDGDRE